ncbi:MAG: glycoside hydrolase family 57 protein [Candidatus Omnitrophica bacterium]|nr:glycoside hydrolase family 57 protein [Candidatus Omnitrophota bacterium]
MKKSPTKIIFLWHMHQPCYKSPNADYYLLPWVRLHGVKDYYGMARTVDKFNTLKVSFNFSGILLEQLLDYVNNHAQDYFSMLSLKNPAYLKPEEKKFVIERFFSINFDRSIRPHRRYLQLYNKKMSKGHFKPQDIGDLQALFNLCWFHPYTIKEDKEIRALITKEKNYTQADRALIIKKHYEILSRIIPLYNKLLGARRIEITVTPYHHPIMPLIYDTDILNEFPYLKKPLSRFSAPPDCFWHLEKAKDVFKRAFGELPRGSWPSEGSVSEDVVALYARAGFKWIGTDEGILFKSLTTENVSYDMIRNQRHIIHRPYKFKGVNIFFRDRNLSDIISFTYQGWEDPKFAAYDLIEHFKRAHSYVKNIFPERIVTIIMDGENAWEYYKNNGVDFLEALYSSLEKSDCLTTTTPSDFLTQTESKKLERLAPGSWINNDFGVWVGNKKNNAYWLLVRRIRDLIAKQEAGLPKVEEARQYFYLIEGSDWFWWNTFEDVSGEFKRIFFMYVEKIYRLLGKQPPTQIK